MSTIINGDSPSITFSDNTTQSTAALPLTGGTVTGGVNLATSSGNVGIGTATPSTKLNIYGSSPSIYLEQNTGVAGNTQIRLNAAGGANTASIRIQDKYIWNSTANGSLLNFGADLTTPQMQLDSSGNLLVGTTDTSATANPGFKLNYFGGVPQQAIVTNTATAGNTPFTIYNLNATNNGYRFYAKADGGLANYSANNINLSDERTKKDIKDAGNYLEKICAISVKTFKYKDQSDDLLNLGVIAQDVEKVAPELVDINGWEGDIPEDGIPLKSIYQTDLQYALMKCIQELKAELDATKAEVAELKAK